MFFYLFSNCVKDSNQFVEATVEDISNTCSTLSGRSYLVDPLTTAAIDSCQNFWSTNSTTSQKPLNTTRRHFSKNDR